MPVLLNRKIQQGFLRFGADEESIVLSESLTDGVPTSAGYNSIGGPTFDAGGIIPSRCRNTIS